MLYKSKDDVFDIYLGYNQLSIYLLNEQGSICLSS